MDRQSFAQLLADRKDVVYGFALQMLGSVEDAEDVTQDVFLKLWRQGGNVEEAARRAWLMRVCRNACFDRLRRRKVRRSHRADPSQTVEGAGSSEGPHELPGRDLGVDLSDRGEGALRIEHEAELNDVISAISRLNEPQRSVILLREVHDMAYDDIAQALDISLSSVKVSLHRARRKVREWLEEKEPMENTGTHGQGAGA